MVKKIVADITLAPVVSGSSNVAKGTVIAENLLFASTESPLPPN